MAMLWQWRSTAVIAGLSILGLLTQSDVIRGEAPAPTGAATNGSVVVTPAAAPAESAGRVPKGAMLTSSDLPAGYTQVSDKTQETGGDGGLSYSYSYCRSSNGWPIHPSVGERLRTLLHTEKVDTMVVERTVRYASVDHARRQFAASEAAVRGCQPALPGTGMSITRQSFAGEESLLVRSRYGSNAEARHVLVRQGDLIAEVWAKPRPSDQEAVRIAQRAAARLCEATTAC